MRKIKLKNLVILSLLISVLTLGTVISPFGLFGNPALVKNDGTALFKISVFADVQLAQNLLTLDNLNALLNEEEIVISPETMESAIQNGIKLSLPVNAGAYGHMNLFGLRFVPYAVIDGTISLALPKTFSELLFDNKPLIDETIESSVVNFMKANVKASIGSQIHFGAVFVDLSLFSPVLYNAQSGTYAQARYTSSASPAEANLDFEATMKFLATVDPGNINQLLADPSQFIETLGVNIGFGFGNDTFGIAVKDITILNAKAIYEVDMGIAGNITYQGEATDITFDATYSVSDPQKEILPMPVNISDTPKITGYLKNDGFLMWGVAGMYALDGDWAAKVYAGLNTVLLRLYYLFGVYPNYYSHTLGIGFNLGVLNGDLQISTLSSEINPLGNTTPGFGISLRFAGGL